MCLTIVVFLEVTYRNITNFNDLFKMIERYCFFAKYEQFFMNFQNFQETLKLK